MNTQSFASWMSLLILSVFLSPEATAQEVPSGSYQRSCNGIFVRDGNLFAQCLTRGGIRMSTRLNGFAGCVGDIWNGDGNLLCSRGPIPPGSYQRSCRDIRIDPRSDRIDLVGQCQDRSGNFRSSRLSSPGSCVGDIWNGDGNLLCNRAPLPEGSYQLSCRDSVTDGSTLTSVCKDREGRELRTSLAYRGCTNDIANINGRLQCVVTRCSPQDRIPPFSIVSSPTASSRATRSGDLFALSRAEGQDDRRYDSYIGFRHTNPEPTHTVVTAFPRVITGEVSINGFGGYAQAGVALRLVVQTPSGTQLCIDEQVLNEQESPAGPIHVPLDTPRRLTCDAGSVEGTFESRVYLRTWASATFFPAGAMQSSAEAHVNVGRLTVGCAAR